MVISDIDERQCTYHPNVRTRLRCSKCGTPICPRCAVETPVGYRCPDCAAVRGLPTYRTTPQALVKSILVGVAVAIAVGVLWGYFPAWEFYLSLLLGFGVAEGMSWAANYKRGSDLQAIAVLCVLGGLVVARVVIAQRLGIPPTAIPSVLGEPGASQALQFQPLPDLLFAALAVIIPIVRFR